MGLSLKIAMFAFALGATGSVAPARDAPTLAARPMAWSLSGADAAPTFDLPQIEEVAIETLLDDDDFLPAPRSGDEKSLASDLETMSLLQLVEVYADLDARDPQLDCLARAIYFETRGEPLEGQLAVGEVVVNRAASRRFPSDYCDVIREYRQFSFVRAGRIPEPRRDSEAWATSVAIARIVDARRHATPLDGALFFHANYVDPRWRLARMGSIGNHIFYR